MLKFFISLFVLGLFTSSFSQPHLTGRVDLDIKKGIIQCDFTLSKVPEIVDYKILLNHGMNIKFFQTETDSLISYSGYSNGKTNDEAIEYYFVDNEEKQVALPSTFAIQYTGAFPVYKNELNNFDFKGLIAFNYKTLRATEQTKWYPVLYDVKNDKLLDQYTYDIVVNTAVKQSIYINGCEPQSGSELTFSSKKAQSLFLFAGDYKYHEVDGNYILNSNVSDSSRSKIFSNIKAIKNKYSELFNTSFDDNITFINFEAVKEMGDNEWGFNTFPAFGFSNIDFNNLLREDGLFKENKYKFFAHEFAHNYFGGNVNSGNLSWFWVESTAEYLSFYLLEEYTNAEFTSGYYNYYTNFIADLECLPLSKITESEQIHHEYRYILGPLILKSYEIIFGKVKTINTLKALLDLAKTETLNLKSWKKAALKSEISERGFENFKKTFLSSKKFKENVIGLIRQHLSLDENE